MVFPHRLGARLYLAWPGSLIFSFVWVVVVNAVISVYHLGFFSYFVTVLFPCLTGVLPVGKTLDFYWILVIYFNAQKFLTYLHSFLTSLLFLINLYKILSNYCIKIKALFYEDPQGFSSRKDPNQKTMYKIWSFVAAD